MKHNIAKYVLILCAIALTALTGTGYCADFLWGTEGQGLLVSDHRDMPMEKQNIVHQINDVFGMKLVKVRLRLPSNDQLTADMCHLRGTHYTAGEEQCNRPGSLAYNLDETAALFQANGWSMMPMFSHAGGPRQNIVIDQAHINRYVDFVDWFLERYREKANIQYIELVNAPYHTWSGTEKQLFELCNKTYERVKDKHPQVQVGTPGFEYYRDTLQRIRGKDQFRFRTYFLEHDAKFDFWAFHGYPTLGSGGRLDFYPPTQTALQDKFAGIHGIVLLRERLNQNGWQNRKIIDTEHTGLLVPGRHFDQKEDRANAAFMTQQLILKRALTLDGKPVLSGIITMKILPRCQRNRPERTGSNRRGDNNRMQQRPSRQSSNNADLQPLFGGECSWGSLNSDGSSSQSVKAVGLLIRKLSGMRHAEHVSGAFDDDKTVWIEKFQKDNQDLFICFKPFIHRPGQRPELEDIKTPVELKLTKWPQKIIITDIFGENSVLDPGKSILHSVGNAPLMIQVIY